jgi:hypothetical protein
MPSKHSDVWTQTIGSLGRVFGAKINWTNLATRWNLNNDGSLDNTPTDDNASGFDEQEYKNQNLAAHPVANYVKLLSLEQKNSLRHGVNDEISQVANSIIAQKDPLDYTATLKQSDFVNIPEANLTYFPNLGNVLTSTRELVAETMKSFAELKKKITNSNSIQLNTAIQGDFSTENNKGGIMSFNTNILFQFGDGLQGFSETVYLTGDVTLGSALVKAEKLAKARDELGGYGCDITGIRVGSHDLPNVTQVDAEPLVANDKAMLNNLVGTGKSDFPEVCLVLRGEDQTGHRRSFTISGLPDDATTHSSRRITDNGWKADFNKWVRLMTGGDYGWKSIDNGNTNPLRVCSGFANVPGPFNPVVAPNQNFTMQILNHGLNDGDKIRVQGFRGTGVNPNGIHYVFNSDQNNIQLLDYVGNFKPSRLGVVRKQLYVVRAFAKIQQVKFSIRRKGKNAGSPKPRSKKKK